MGSWSRRTSRSTDALLLLGEQRAEVPFAQHPGAGAGRRRRVGRLGEHALDPGPQPIGGGVRAAHPSLERVHEPAAPLVEQDQHQLVLGCEVPVERLGRDPGLRQDVAHRRVQRPGPLDQGERGLHDPTHLGLVLGAASRHRPFDGPAGQLLRDRRLHDPPRSPVSASTVFSQSKIRDLATQGEPRRIAGARDGRESTVTEPLVIGDVFRAGARAAPHRTAAALGDRQLTFAEVDAWANRLARALLRRGVGHGARVAMWADTGLESVPLFAALSKLGAVFCPLNGRWGDDEAAAMLDRLRPALSLVDGPRTAAGAGAGAAPGPRRDDARTPWPRPAPGARR